nr:reverse transcriptase domain-containing protein [Tanacetum cinerariifolium]
MNYLEEQTDGEAMIKSIKNGDQPLPRVTQMSIAGTTSTEQPPQKDKFMCNKNAKDLWDALARHMLGSEYGEQDRKAAVLYEYETFKATKGELLLDTYIRYLQVINDLKYCGYSNDNCELNFKFLNNLQPEWKQYGTMMRQNKNLMDINIDALYNFLKQNQGDVNDAMRSKKKIIVVTSNPLALIAEKTKVSKSKEKVVVFSDFKGSEADDFSELKKITALLAKAFNRRKFYSKPTNNNLRTSFSSQSANKKQEFLKTDNKRVKKILAEDQANVYAAGAYNQGGNSHQPQDTFYNGLTLRHRDTINAAAGGTFMKRNQGNSHAIPKGNNQGRNQFFQGASHGQNPPPAYQALAYQSLGYQAPVHQPLIPQPQVVTTTEFTNYMKANDMNTASSSGLRTLPSNTITNLKGDLKGIITQSGNAYQGPTIPTTFSSPPEVVERKTEEPPEVELKDLPPHLEYAFLEGDDKLPIIIAKDLSVEEKATLIKVLKLHKRAIAWKLSDIKVTGWQVCIDYRKLNKATQKDHFPLPFMDQMLKRLARNEYYCFLDGFSGYFQIPIDPRDQEKTTFTCPYGTSAYRRM